MGHDAERDDGAGWSKTDWEPAPDTAVVQGDGADGVGAGGCASPAATQGGDFQAADRCEDGAGGAGVQGWGVCEGDGAVPGGGGVKSSGRSGVALSGAVACQDRRCDGSVAGVR